MPNKPPNHRIPDYPICGPSVLCDSRPCAYWTHPDLGVSWCVRYETRTLDHAVCDDYEKAGRRSPDEMNTLNNRAVEQYRKAKLGERISAATADRNP